LGHQRGEKAKKNLFLIYVMARVHLFLIYFRFQGFKGFTNEKIYIIWLKSMLNGNTFIKSKEETNYSIKFKPISTETI
jgi:hypothetical protein